jgi:type I restriction-modification system DNA methylase subunit
MKQLTVDSIHDVTLQLRELLITEIGELLEGIYGLLPNGELKPIEDYPVLGTNSEALETRERVESLVTDEVQAGLTPQLAREKLVIEASFTWLNRLVAFKMMEARKLLRQCVTRRQDSNGFKIWLTEDGNEEHLKGYETGDMPQDGLGEGPRQRAYRHFLVAQCAQLAKEIRVLFDPSNLASRLCPRPQVLRQIIESLNQDHLSEAWESGNEETIGWVYQFFIEEQKKQIFDRFYKKKEKVRPEDIPAATQIFTPRWIVQFLVQNTLGRMWLQMHPDTRLGEQLKYLVPPASNLPSVILKPVREIRLLDPACGTMHFGLIAFDLLAEMYREELERAGDPGWPREPSVRAETEIPATILAQNLHGVDIDLRAVQLSALTLYLRAKTLNPKAALSESRLVCADIHMLDGGRLTQFLEESGLDAPIYHRILSSLQGRLKDSDQLGSLLRIDKEIHRLVDEERKKYQREGGQLLFQGWSEQQFETEAGWHEFWETLEVQIGQALDAFAREQSMRGLNQGFFAGEATKGLRLLEIVGQRYDIVLTNPPYMTSRNMNGVLKQYLGKEYKPSKSDLYAAFIQRCSEWLLEGGRLGMITQQSFMFTSSYEKLRELLCDRVALEVLPHVGPRAFEEVTGEKVNTTLFVFRRDSNEVSRNSSVATYFRLVREPDGESKRHRFEQALSAIKTNQSDSLVYFYPQSNFKKIKRAPWCYWAGEFEYNIFSENPSLSTLFDIDMGLKTSKNFRFVRWWWEVGSKQISFALSREEAKASGQKWFRYAKGGKTVQYSSDVNHAVNWKNDGAEIKAFLTKQYPYLDGKVEWCTHNEDLYFRPGVAWLPVSTSGLRCRLIPEGTITSNASYGIFVSNERVATLLAFMNSIIGRYLARILCPTINHNKGDIALLPVPDLILEDPALALLGNRAISAVSTLDQYDETSPSFVCPAESADTAELDEITRQIDDRVLAILGVEEMEAFLRDFLETPLEADADDTESTDNTDDESEEGGDQLDSASSSGDLERRWLSYAIGTTLNRFEVGFDEGLGRGKFESPTVDRLRALVLSDGILALDPGHPDDMVTKVLQVLGAMVGDDSTESIIFECTGKKTNPENELRKYIEGTFFKEHIQRYRKRPVYWLLQSPRKKYGIWIFHEKLTRDTLYLIRGDKFLGSKIRLLEGQLGDLKAEQGKVEGSQRRGLIKKISELEDILQDLREFAARIDSILQRGYTPHFDDGVLINMCPLWELIPGWQSELQKYWQGLDQGKYDWSFQAMDHRPKEVREKCREDNSFSIAHGIAAHEQACPAETRP